MRRSKMATILGVVLAAGTGFGLIAETASAQVIQNGAATAAGTKRANLNRLTRPITVDFQDQRLEDIITYLVDVTGAEIETIWSDGGSGGLDKDKRLTMSIKNLSALTVLERVLAKSQTDLEQNSWQLTPYGTVEIGPKAELNKTRRVEIYDINDMLFVIPRYAEVPELDLEGVLQQAQQGGGGGGGQNPFNEDEGDQNEEPLPTRQERADSVISLITSLVEPEQWQDNGGEGGTIRFYQGSVIVNAPDYMHRQINGYPFWPSTTQRAATGKRYVSLTGDTGNAQIDEIINVPVTAVVPGGGGGGGNGGGGGGASATPAPKAPAAKPSSKDKPKTTTPAKKSKSSTSDKNKLPKLGLK